MWYLNTLSFHWFKSIYLAVTVKQFQVITMDDLVNFLKRNLFVDDILDIVTEMHQKCFIDDVALRNIKCVNQLEGIQTLLKEEGVQSFLKAIEDENTFHLAIKVMQKDYNFIAIRLQKSHVCSIPQQLK